MNTKRLLFILFVILAQILAACGTSAPATPALEPTTAPPPAPTATPVPAAPAEVVQGFWTAMETGDLDAAMTFVAEDAKCRGACYFSGTNSFNAYLQGRINAGLVTQISDVKVEGDTVTYLYKVFRNDIEVEENAEGESMQILDGKIILWNNLHTF